MTFTAFPIASMKVRLANGTTYAYTHLKPSGDKPYVLLLHGFPSTAYDWRHQIAFLAKKGYGVIAPDLLGYGGTDKPTEPEAYRMKKMAADIAFLLDTLDVKLVIGVGHDWGSGLLSRLANYHPERFRAYVFMDIGYSAPNPKFSIDEVNEKSTQTIGYPIMGYYHFFNSADAAELMDQKPESTVSCIFPGRALSMKDNLSLPGAARSWFEEGKVGPIASWLSHEEVETHHQLFAAENGGYGPGLNWYKCQMGNLNSEDEASIPEKRNSIEQPTLLLTCRDDPVGVPVLQEAGTKPFVRNLKIKQVDTGHWLQLERPDEVNNILIDFLEGLERF